MSIRTACRCRVVVNLTPTTIPITTTITTTSMFSAGSEKAGQHSAHGDRRALCRHSFPGAFSRFLPPFSLTNSVGIMLRRLPSRRRYGRHGGHHLQRLRCRPLSRDDFWQQRQRRRMKRQALFAAVGIGYRGRGRRREREDGTRQRGRHMRGVLLPKLPSCGCGRDERGGREGERCW